MSPPLNNPVIRDIRARFATLTTDAVVSAEDQLASSLLRVANVSVLLLSPNHRVVYVNAFFEELSGYALAEIEGRDWIERFIFPEDRERVRHRFAAAINGNATHGDTNAIRLRNGEARIVEWHDQTLKAESGSVLGLLVIGHDVTKREAARKAELALRASNQLLEAMFENSIVCLAYLDTEFNFVRVNSRYAEADGKRPEDFVGKNHFDLYPNPDNEAVFERVRATGKPHSALAKPFEYAHNRERGVSHWDWRLTPVRDTTGDIVGFVLALQDVSERIEAIEAVQERETRIAKELQQKEILLQEVHHRVKNNLQVVSSMLSLQATTCDDPKLARLFSEGQDRLYAMSLVHRILYESGDVTRLSFTRYLEELTESLRAAYVSLGQRIVIQTNVQDDLLDLDQATPCGLIASELITNAFKYAFPERDIGTIRVTLQPAPGNKIRLCISDDGVGIPPGAAEESKNLGLKLVRALTRQLVGELQVRVDRGTEFVVIFDNATAIEDGINSVHAARRVPNSGQT